MKWGVVNLSTTYWKMKGVITMKKLLRSEYFTIPNLLGYFRILLIPVYLYLYFKAETKGDYLLAAAVIGVSGLTDCLDGKIARKFNMITEFGKILDPIADKLTQGALVISLMLRFPLMEYVFGLFVIKEIYMSVMGAVMLKKGKKMDGAQWCGKVCTSVLYVVMLLLILLPDINIFTANILMLICMLFMTYSLVSYMIFYFHMWKELALSRKETNRIQISEEKEILGENTVSRKKGWKRKLVMIGIAAAALAYLILGAVLPYRRQPEIGENTKEQLNVDYFYSDKVSCDRAMVIKENSAALDERIRMIANARERIILSTFAFQSDEAGKDMLAALYDAACRGIEIKILADGFNSWMYMEYNPYFYALSSMPNVEIKLYNKVNLLTPWTSMGRMHDKYVIADEDVYILGGRNTLNYFLGDYDSYKNHDWDTLVYNTGGTGSPSSVYQVKKYFYDIWELDCCRLFHNSEKLADKISVKKAANELAERYEDIRVKKPELFLEYDYTKVTRPTDKITLISNPTGIYPKEPVCFYTLVQLMKNAREEAYIHTPYVVCNNAMYRALVEIVDSDVHLKLLTNSAVNNGNLFAAGDYLENKETLIQTGTDIWEYEGGISYHGKCMAIDDDMSVIGSFNMDMRSVYLDTELMLAIDSKELNRDLRQHMASYEEKAMHVTGADSYEMKEGMTKQEMSALHSFKIKIMRTIVGWARFLL